MRHTIGRLLPAVAAALLLGISAPGAGAAVRIGVVLRHPDPAGEQRLETALYDPSSPEYQRWLTPRAYARRFGVAPAFVAATQTWLRDAGMRVRFTAGAGDYLIAEGSSGALKRLLGVTLTDHGGFRAADRPPTVPSGLPVASIIGLDSREQHLPVNAGRPNAPDTGERSPQDLWAIYQQPADNIGHGVSVGIIGAGDTDGPTESVHAFDEKNGLPEVKVDVVKTPADGDFSYTGVAGEWNLDVAAVSGMAPGVDRLVLYTSPTYKDTDLMGSLAAWVNDPDGPLVFNESYGECEPTPANSIFTNPALSPLDGNENPSDTQPQYGLGNSSHPAEDQFLTQAVMEGRTLFASTGDNGAGCGAVYAGPVGAGNGAAEQIDGLTEDPASNPNAVGVGGTVLYKDDASDQPTRSLEYAWTHGGGNSSPFITAPDYQQNVPNLTRTCVSDQQGQPTNTGKVCRGVPDVAALSGDLLGNGYAGSGGTSLSAPLWAGMWARVIASTPNATGFGFANPALYKVAKDAGLYAKAFFDVTVGSNGNPALPGYDYVTGLGTPNVAPLIEAIKATTPVRAGAAPPAAVAPAATCTDRMAPAARLTRIRITRKRIALRGTARDRGCETGGAGVLSRVQVAVARKAGRRCAFVTSRGRLAKARSCARPRYLKAKGTGAWTLLRKAKLRRGRYVVLVRAIDLAGNRGGRVARAARVR